MRKPQIFILKGLQMAARSLGRSVARSLGRSVARSLGRSVSPGKIMKVDF
jgi:hypothetical protein